MIGKPIDIGEFGYTGTSTNFREFELVNIGPGGYQITIQYTDTFEEEQIGRDELDRVSGELQL